jgi:hypothetical protein
MRRVGVAALLGGAAVMAAASVHAAPLISFSLNLPAPNVPSNQVLSPSAIAARLGQKGFRVSEMYRKGSAYAVTAMGPSGNKVLLMVDGRSGVILGLNVLAAKVAVAPQRAPTAVFIDDRHPFGAVVPAVVYDSWQRYDQPQWAKPGPAVIAARPSRAPFRYAVPYSYVHASPKTGRSFAVAPPNYKGYQLRDEHGEAIREADTRADAADAEAAYQAERADQAQFDSVNAREDAREARESADAANGLAADANDRADAADESANAANERADQADRDSQAISDDNQALIDAADAADKRAEAAETQNADLQRQLAENGTADQACTATTDGCDPATGGMAGLAPEPEPAADEAAPQEESPAAEAAAPAQEEQTAPPNEPAADEAAPQEQSPPAEAAAPAQEEQAAPPSEPASEPAAEEAAPQQDSAPAEEAAPQEEAAPPEEPPEEPQAEEPQAQDQPDNGGDNGGDMGGGGDDGGGGGGGDDDPN